MDDFWSQVIKIEIYIALILKEISPCFQDFVKQDNVRTINIVLFLFWQSIEATSYHGLIEKMDVKCDDHEMLSLFTDLVSMLKGAFSYFVLFCKYSFVFSGNSTNAL